MTELAFHANRPAEPRGSIRSRRPGGARGVVCPSSSAAAGGWDIGRMLETCSAGDPAGGAV